MNEPGTNFMAIQLIVETFPNHKCQPPGGARGEVRGSLESTSTAMHSWIFCGAEGKGPQSSGHSFIPLCLLSDWITQYLPLIAAHVQAVIPLPLPTQSTSPLWICQDTRVVREEFLL